MKGAYLSASDVARLRWSAQRQRIAAEEARQTAAKVDQARRDAARAAAAMTSERVTEHPSGAGTLLGS